MSRLLCIRSACLLALLASCGGNTPAPSPPAAASAPAPTASAPASASAPVDPLGSRPIPGPPPDFVPPVPQVLEGPGSSRIWLLERRSLPLITVAVVVPYGSATESAEKAGLAFVTADMLDEGTKQHDALAFSQALNDLGARLASSADRDASIVSLQVLATKFEQALPLLAEAIVTPRHDPKDFARVKALWNNTLKNRAQEPNEVARIVTSLAYYGDDHPYGHPTDGTLRSAAHIDLAEVSRWHHAIWRPDAATFVVVGDINADTAKALLTRAFAGWKSPPGNPPVPVTPPAPTETPGIRTFAVDRADVPQVVMSIARRGPSASDPAYPRVTMLNIALGGSFTSRLNQNLREEHGWTYGARSRFNSQRGAGMFVVRAAIRADAIAPALHETTVEISKMAKQGLSADELTKLRALVSGDALETYSTLHGAAGSLASNAALGLAPDQDQRDLASQRSATNADLTALASTYLDISSGVVVLVGPREAVDRAIADNALPPPKRMDAEGRQVAAH